MPRLRLGRARAPRRRARERLERELAERLPELELFRLDADAVAQPGRAGADRSRASRRPTAPCCSERRWWRRATTSRASRSRRSSTPTRAWRSRTSAPRSAPSSSSRSSPAAAGATRPGRVLVQTYQPDSRPIALAARHDGRGVPRRRARAAARARLSALPPPRAHRRLRARRRRAHAPCSRELRAGLEGVGRRAARARRRSSASAAATARSCSPRPRTRGRVASRAARLLAAAAPAMRRDGLTASVDVDPQDLLLGASCGTCAPTEARSGRDHAQYATRAALDAEWHRHAAAGIIGRAPGASRIAILRARTRWESRHDAHRQSAIASCGILVAGLVGRERDRSSSSLGAIMRRRPSSGRSCPPGLGPVHDRDEDRDYDRSRTRVRPPVLELRLAMGEVEGQSPKRAARRRARGSASARACQVRQYPDPVLRMQAQRGRRSSTSRSGASSSA